MQTKFSSISIVGNLQSHKDQITCLKTSLKDQNLLISGSRDKTICLWQIKNLDNSKVFGVVKKRLIGHHHIIQDIDLSIDCEYVLSASWDKTLRLWNLKTGETINKFNGHVNDVLSVAFSPDNRQIVSGSRDKTIRLWNTIGICKWISTKLDSTNHLDWVTCVRFLPNIKNEPILVSTGWDKHVKVIELKKQKLKWNLKGHKNHINAITISPDGSLCASGDKSGKTILWDLNEGKLLWHLDCQSMINDLCFSPNRYWLCSATQLGNIRIWDLESKEIVAELTLDIYSEISSNLKKPSCNCIAWNKNGCILYAGYADSIIRIWKLLEI